MKNREETRRAAMLPAFAFTHKTKLILAYLAVYIIWGSTYFASSIVVKEIPPLYAAGTRFTIAGILLFIWNVLHGEALPKGKEWSGPVLIAIFLLVLTNGSTTIACALIPSSVVSLLQATAPGWTVLFDTALFRRERHPATRYAGILLGVVGVSLLILAKNQGGMTFGINPVGAFFALGSVCFWAFGNVLCRDVQAPASTLMSSAVSMIMAGPILLALGFLTSKANFFVSAPVTMRSVAGLAYLIVFGTFLAFCSHCWLVRVEPASRVATSTLVNPVVAMFLGAVFGGEILTVQMLIGAAVIFFSVLLIWRK